MKQDGRRWSTDKTPTSGKRDDPSLELAASPSRGVRLGTCAAVSDGKDTFIIRQGAPPMNTMSSRPRMHYQSNVLNPTQSATPVDAGLRWERDFDAGVICRLEDVGIERAFHVP